MKNNIQKVVRGGKIRLIKSRSIVDQSSSIPDLIR